MSKKLLSHSSSRALQLAQYIEQSKNFYPENAVLVKKVPAEKAGVEAEQYPGHSFFQVLDLRGYEVTSLASPGYESAFLRIQNERHETPIYIH